MAWTLGTLTLDVLLEEANGTTHPIVRLKFFSDKLDEEGYPEEFYYEILLDQEVPVRG